MSKRKTRLDPTSALASHAHPGGAAMPTSRIAMPEFCEDAMRYLEESRRLILRSRSMERVGGSRFRQCDKDTRPL
jgi:hypothetical protein